MTPASRWFGRFRRKALAGIDRPLQRLRHSRDLQAWAEFLRERPQAARSIDIREHVLAHREEPAAIGYPEGNLTQGYARQLPRLLKALSCYDTGSSQWRRSKRFFATGAIHERAGPSHPGLGRALQAADFNAGDELILFEQGFLASAYSWIEAYKTHRPEAACLGYVYDDIAHYYMADCPNRLIERLNGPQELSKAELERVRGLILRIVSQKLSKYNDQPLGSTGIGTSERRRVLVCDQAYADASTVYGRIDGSGFRAMLAAAIEENPDAEVLVKTHPDTAARPGTRSGYYNGLEEREHLKVIKTPVNPYSILELVDKVYVGTSQIGLEALMAGKEVICFGAPFYAGWGVTNDRQAIPHRARKRSLEDIFHAFYVWYTIYHVPGINAPSNIEAALDFIEEKRPV